MTLARRLHFAFLQILALLCVLGTAPCFAHIDVQTCKILFDKIGTSAMPAPKESFASVAKSGTAEQREFFRDVFLPVVGIRALRKIESEKLDDIERDARERKISLLQAAEDAAHGDKKFRSCSLEGNCAVLSDFEGGLEFQIKWLPGHSHFVEPRLVFHQGQKVLEIPTGFDFKNSSFDSESLIKRFLIGHPLHPYISSKRAGVERVLLGEDAIHSKKVQLEGQQAAVEAIDAGDDSFLFVAPTGTGKTEVLKSVLSHQIVQNIALEADKNTSQVRRLHTVFADKNRLVGQLEEDVIDVVRRLEREAKALVEQLSTSGKYPKTQFEVIRWGEGSEDNKISMLELIEKAMEDGKQVILVTTVDSFKAKINVTKEPRIEDFGSDVEGYLKAKTIHESEVDKYNDNIDYLRETLATIAFDEAHHAGAPESIGILKDMVDRSHGSKAFLYGTTATPTHQQVDLIQEVFKERAFWAYRDDAESYRENGGSVGRTVGEVIEQLHSAIEKGELSPFDLYAVNPEAIEMRPISERTPEKWGNGLFIDSKLVQEVRRPQPQEGSEEEQARRREDEDGEENIHESEDSKKSITRYVMNPAHYRNVINMIHPLIMKNKRGYFAVASRAEAEDFTHALQTYYKDHPSKQPRFAYLHSYLSPKEKQQIQDDFREGKIDYLVTIGMMDEGINVPDLSFVADLNYKTDPKRQLQRIGRVLRIFPGKIQPADVFSFQQVDDVKTAQMLEALDNCGGMCLGSPRGGRKLDQDETVDGVPLSHLWEMLDDAKWTSQNIQRHLTQYFQNEVRGQKRAINEASQLLEFLTKIHEGKGNQIGVKSLRDLDPFTHQERRLQIKRELEKKETSNMKFSTILSQLIKRSDSSSKNAAGNKAFEATIYLARQKHPEVFDWINRFRNEREARRIELQSSEGAARVLGDFLAKYNRLPSLQSSNPDEAELAQKIDHRSQDLTFLMRLEKKNLSPEQRREVNQKFFKPFDQDLGDPKKVFTYLYEFYHQHSRLPKSDASYRPRHVPPESQSIEQKLAEYVEDLDKLSDEFLSNIRAALDFENDADDVILALFAHRDEVRLARKQEQLQAQEAEKEPVNENKKNQKNEGASLSKFDPVSEFEKELPSFLRDLSMLDKLDKAITQRLDELNKLIPNSRFNLHRQNLQTLQEELKTFKRGLIDIYDVRNEPEVEFTELLIKDLTKVLDSVRLKLPAILKEPEVVVGKREDTSEYREIDTAWAKSPDEVVVSFQGTMAGVEKVAELYQQASVAKGLTAVRIFEPDASTSKRNWMIELRIQGKDAAKTFGTERAITPYSVKYREGGSPYTDEIKVEIKGKQDATRDGSVLESRKYFPTDDGAYLRVDVSGAKASLKTDRGKEVLFEVFEKSAAERGYRSPSQEELELKVLELIERNLEQ